MLNRRLAILLLLACAGCTTAQQKPDLVGPPTEAQAAEIAKTFQRQMEPYRVK